MLYWIKEDFLYSGVNKDSLMQHRIKEKHEIKQNFTFLQHIQLLFLKIYKLNNCQWIPN